MTSANDPMADLAAEVADLRKTVRELAGTVSEVGGDLAEQRDTIGEITQTLEELVAKVSPEEHRPVDWRKLDRQQARAEWDRLMVWIEDIAATYSLTRQELPDCWTRHPRWRNELSWLRVAFEQALRPDALASAAADWHMRHLPAARQMLADDANRCGCAGPRHGIAAGPMPDESVLAENTRRPVWDLTGMEEDIAARPALGAD